MSGPIAAMNSDAQRWRDWQERGVQGERRRAAAMRWVMVIAAIGLGVVFSRFL
jgi:hypothetical protein